MNKATQPNLRYHLRIPADLVAYLASEKGPVVQAAIINISRAGMMISCGRDDLSTIIPKGIANAPKRSVEVTVDFSLPILDEGLVVLSQPMIPAYTRRLAKDEYRVGLEFSRLGREQKRLLEQYIAENRNKAESA